MRTFAAIRLAAHNRFPSIAHDEIPRDGDRRTIAVLVTDEDGWPIHGATLKYAGLWLSR
ncbi:DUF6894 family protein [Methylobacterium sp. Leaf112]|uniref:DUF6894 family protein n=1 Tax=Methylobacterium sp. Leaf112 TaxID=1736258 RepID=UPI000B1A2D63|nr:hypothetical protein [Methylobacterium sp. Leaf112]